MSTDRVPPRERPTAAGTDSTELLFRYRRGDENAAEFLFARYLPQLHRWAHRRMPRWARGIVDTADVVQDAVLHTLGRLHAFEPQRQGALLGYLRRSLLNRIRDQFRYAARHPGAVELWEHHPDSRESPLESTLNHEIRERYMLALKELQPDDRHAIVARIELGYSYEQLALVLNRPTAEAARLAVRRALLRLARAMQRG
jgi:RNA polymerase sigma-70 factor (ECF subfamily)